MAAAREWKFTPALRNGKPIESQVRIPFHFRHGHEPEPPAPPTPPNADPAGAIVYASLQSQGGWQTCGGCGNVGGTGQGPDYHMAQGVSNPSLSGSAADFYVNGGPAYTGGYYFVEQPTIANPVSYLRYDFDLFVPGQYANAPQAIEFECQQTTNGNTYNFAWQAEYSGKRWLLCHG